MQPFFFGDNAMIDFNGFSDWIQIFKGGKQTDSNGRLQDGDALIARAVATFNPLSYEPPIVIGHPRSNSPKYGLVRDLKKAGSLLFAKFKDVVPEFENMVKSGRFKKRSASFFPDGRLRHVGFLGAMPPAVKGLSNIQFSEGGNVMSFEFTEGLDAGEFLHQKTLEFMESPPEFSEEGPRLVRTEGPLNYNEAFGLVQEKYPKAVEEYIKQLGI